MRFFRAEDGSDKIGDDDGSGSLEENVCQSKVEDGYQQCGWPKWRQAAGSPRRWLTSLIRANVELVITGLIRLQSTLTVSNECCLAVVPHGEVAQLQG